MPDTLTFTSVVTIPGAHASAAFTSKTSEVFKEENDIAPIIINDKMKYIPGGGDNQMPYNIIDLIESDETLSTCQMFNAEVCYGSGLVYDTELATAQILSAWDSLANSDRYSRFYQRIFDIEFSILRIGEYPIPSIIDIVNSIRLAKGNVFAEWKNSDTAKLFEDHGYKNKKQAGGYFF